MKVALPYQAVGNFQAHNNHPLSRMKIRHKEPPPKKPEAVLLRVFFLKNKPFPLYKFPVGRYALSLKDRGQVWIETIQTHPIDNTQ